MSHREVHKAVEELNKLSGKIIEAAMKVHSALGSRLLESAYEACLRHERLTPQLSLSQSNEVLT